MLLLQQPLQQPLHQQLTTTTTATTTHYNNNNSPQQPQQLLQQQPQQQLTTTTTSTIITTTAGSDELDTQRSFYVESGRYTTKYLRIVRICFTRPFSSLNRNDDYDGSGDKNVDDGDDNADYFSSSSSPSYFSDTDQERLSPGFCEFCSPPSDKLQHSGTGGFASSKLGSAAACRCCRPCSLPRLNSFSTSQDVAQQQLQTTTQFRTSRSKEGRTQLAHSHSLNFGQRRNFCRLQDSGSRQRQRLKSLGKEFEPIYPNYVTFEPVMLSSGGIIGIPLFERLSETMKRAMVWLGKCNPSWWILCVAFVCVLYDIQNIHCIMSVIAMVCIGDGD